MALVLGLATASGCGYYSFTGATIPQRLNTVAVPLTADNSTSPFTDLDNELTQLLIDRFVQQTRLRLETSQTEADAVLSTRIERYENEPASVRDERATLNRVTVTVAVSYFDRTEEQELLDRQSFSSFAEYDPVADGRDGEREAAFAALEDIADDIFTAATSNW